MEYIKPPIVLAVIVALISALIIVTYNFTYVDTSNILTDKQAAAVTQIYGGSAENYAVVPQEIWQEKLSGDEFARITKVIRKLDGSLAFEAVVKGYKDGFDILVGVKDGAVAGVAVVSTGEETPGLGTMTNDSAFVCTRKGISGDAAFVRKGPAAGNEAQAATSATYSSKAVASAVNLALKAYEKCGGEL